MMRSKDFRRAFICAALFVPIIIAGLLIHELGHSIVIIMFGGNVLDFGLRISGGFVLFNNVAHSLYWIIGLAGGVVWAIYYVFLASKITKLLYVPALFSLFYAIFEMFYAVDNATILYSNMDSLGMFVLVSTFIVLMLNLSVEFVRMRWEW